MTGKCEKSGCEKGAVNKLRITDIFKRVDTQDPVALCEQHLREAQRFSEMDVAGLKKWLKADS